MMRHAIFLITTLVVGGVSSYELWAQDTAYISDQSTLKSEDESELRQIIARLNHALDSGDYALYSEYFADDGVFVSGFGDAIGPEQVANALQQVSPYISGKRHIAGNLVISGSGDEATVTSYLIVFERELALEYVGSAVNVDTFKRIDSKWKVVRHESTLDPATERYISQQMTK